MYLHIILYIFMSTHSIFCFVIYLHFLSYFFFMLLPILSIIYVHYD